MNKKLIAVYGSLRHGEYNFERFENYFGKDNIKIKEKNIRILLPATMVNLGSYPALIKADTVKNSKTFLNNIGELSVLATEPVHSSEKISFDILECSESVHAAICDMEKGAYYTSEQIDVKTENKTFKDVTIFYADNYLTDEILKKYLGQKGEMVVWDGDWKKVTK